MKTLLVLLLLILTSGSLQATTPDPNRSEVPDCITLDPEGAIPYTVVVRDFNGVPFEGLVVELVFDPTTNSMVAWCTGAEGPYFAAVTSPMGQATFFLEGGGCILSTTLAECGASFVAEVFASGVLLEEVGCVNSLDAINSMGELPSCPPPVSNCEGGMTTGGLGDAVFHTYPIALGIPSLCSDFTGPVYGDLLGLADAVMITSTLLAIVDGVSCPCP